MIQADLVRQLLAAAKQTAAEQKAMLPRHACPTTKMADDVELQFAAAYLSGVNQMATFLARNDGEEGLDAQAIMNAASEAGKRLGFVEEPGKKDTRGT